MRATPLRGAGLYRSASRAGYGAQPRSAVNVVAPGPTDTPMLSDPGRAHTPPALPPLGRLVAPDEVAGLTAFLLGPEGGAITGQHLVQCAGASLWNALHGRRDGLIRSLGHRSRGRCAVSGSRRYTSDEPRHRTATYQGKRSA